MSDPPSNPSQGLALPADEITVAKVHAFPLRPRREPPSGRNTLFCIFCHASQHDVEFLIVSGACICAGCIDVAADQLAALRGEESAAQKRHLEEIRVLGT